MKIGDVIVSCEECGWVGRVYDAEPDVDGDGNLGCPKACRNPADGDFIIVKQIIDQSFKMN